MIFRSGQITGRQQGTLFRTPEFTTGNQQGTAYVPRKLINIAIAETRKKELPTP